MAFEVIARPKRLVINLVDLSAYPIRACLTQDRFRHAGKPSVIEQVIAHVRQPISNQAGATKPSVVSASLHKRAIGKERITHKQD